MRVLYCIKYVFSHLILNQSSPEFTGPEGKGHNLALIQHFHVGTTAEIGCSKLKLSTVQDCKIP